MKIAYQPHDYCGICPYFKNMIYYETEKHFQEDNRNPKEESYCGFFFPFPIKLTEEEYENIPDWCPLDDAEEGCKCG